MYEIFVSIPLLFRKETFPSFAIRHVGEVIRPYLFVFLSPGPAINNDFSNDIIN